MTYEEKRMILRLRRDVDELQGKIDALCKLVDEIAQRRRGRPTKAAAKKIEQMRNEANG